MSKFEAILKENNGGDGWLVGDEVSSMTQVVVYTSKVVLTGTVVVVDWDSSTHSK